MHTRSGSRSRVHATARSTALAPRDGSPRWKSERWTIRMPSSSAGSAGTSTSSVRSRTQPASYQPQASAARAMPPPGRPRSRAGSDFELLDGASHRHDVALELQLRRLEARPRRRSAATGGGSACRARGPSPPRASPARRPATGGRAGTASPSRRLRPRSPARSAGSARMSATSSRAWMIGKPQHLIFAG